MEKGLETATLNLVRAIGQSEVYKQYEACAKNLDQFPGVLEKIAEFRRATIAQYHNPDNSDLLGSSDKILEDYSEIQKIPEVNAFLEAEDALVRALQQINSQIAGAVDMKVPNL
ncbi:MAG: YlbF family regulator [Lachnospiraceae bacterium]|nr:YlbF family regulator [Lachnospiraceae bacterium]